MNIYQKKIVKENETIFLEDCVHQKKNNNKISNPDLNREPPHNLNIRKFYGLSSKLLKKTESSKNNRQISSKSQIFSSSQIISNLIPPEIKTIIIKLDNPKEQKISKDKNNNKINEERNNKNINNLKNNNFSTNYISFISPSPDKKHTRNKSLILNNKNDNSSINISVNTIYKKSYCLDKQKKAKINKERSTTSSQTNFNIEDKNTKIDKKLIKNISTPNILNTIDLIIKPKNKEKNNNRRYVSTNIYQNININNNINNLNVVQYDLSISHDKKNNVKKISEILTGRNNKHRSNNSKNLNFNAFESMDNSFLNKNNSKKIKEVSKFNDILDKMNNIFSSRHSKFNLYNNNKNKYVNKNNRNQFLLNKINAMKINSKNKDNILKTNNNINKNDKCKIDFIYKNRNKMDNKNKEIYSNDNNKKIIDENIDYDINIKSNNTNKTNKIKSIPLKLNNSCIFGIASK